MSELSVGVRELKSHLSEYLRQVKKGRTVVITEHGQPVGRIVPEPKTLDAKTQALIDAGELEWSGQKLKPTKPVARVRGNRTVADIVVENRE